MIILRSYYLIMLRGIISILFTCIKIAQLTVSKIQSAPPGLGSEVLLWTTADFDRSDEKDLGTSTQCRLQSSRLPSQTHTHTTSSTSLVFVARL